MAERLNILVLHCLGDPARWRPAMVDHELCLPKFAPGHNYIVHDAAMPLPSFVRDIGFDGIVLTQTFLGRRRHRRVFERIRREYDFVRSSTAVKLAMPQDDYECSELLDDWLDAWQVDRIYTVCPDHWPLLYPRGHAAGKLRLGFTGYISDALIERWKTPRPLLERPIDVSYRTVRMPAHIGRVGLTKWAIGPRFVTAVQHRELVVDISVDPKDAIVGERWQEFLERSRFVLGANSGSSMYDPSGEISARALAYQVRHPQASFEEVEAACFPGVDGKYLFTAISPRNLECGLIESAQILTPGEYSGILQAHTHFISLDPNMGNIAEVLERMADVSAVLRMVRACKEALLSYPTLKYEHHVSELCAIIAAGTAARGMARGAQQAVLFERYRSHIAAVEHAFWRKLRLRERAQHVLLQLGAQRVKHMLLRPWRERAT
jgi:hypothetical protein